MKVFALSGLTECGKYTAARYLEQFGVKPFKIDHLLRAVQQKAGNTEPFQAWNFRLEHEQPEWLFSSLYNEIMAATRQTGSRACSIESLYGPVLPRFLARIMGPDFVVVYVDASYEVRLQRQISHHGPEGVDEARSTLDQKDHFKRARGNLEVRAMANEILDNSGALAVFHDQLLGMLARHGLPVSVRNSGP
jgi:dephospho-CoA kinase